jgi:S-layer homology domain
MTRRILFILIAVAAAVAALGGCAGHEVRCTSAEDNPAHHYLRGMEALEAKKIAVAQEKFDRALYCNEKFSYAYGGNALVSGEKAKSQSDGSFQAVEVERAQDNLRKAYKYADSKEETFDYDLAQIRLRTLLKDKGWLAGVEDAYADASKLPVDEQKLIYYQGKEAATYFTGLAYLEALDFQKARDSFAAVLNAKREGKWHERADKAWKKTDRIVRALAGITVGDVGKKIAIKDEVTRADLAALLIDEMKLEKLFAGRIPAASQVAAMKAEFTPADVLNHPFKEEILTMMKWKVRGMEPKPDETTKAYLFKPTDDVSRGEMAFILEDVLTKLTGDEKLATAYFGQEKSPFPDIRNTSPFYNAVMNMTTRGIMEGELSGEFRPNDPVSGAEALLAIRVLKQKINIY